MSSIRNPEIALYVAIITMRHPDKTKPISLLEICELVGVPYDWPYVDQLLGELAQREYRFEIDCDDPAFEAMLFEQDNAMSSAA